MSHTNLPGAAAVFQVGAAAVPIRLPAGVGLAGYARRTGPSTGTLRPLQARAIAVGDDHGTRAIVIVLDLLYVTDALTGRIERLITESTGVAGSQVIISATHTHSGPGIGDPDGAVGRIIVEAAARAAGQALDSAEPARLWTDTVAVDGLGMNRRDGSVPELDAHLLVATRATDPTQVIATVVEFGCHPTVLEHDNLQYSPDYPGYTCELLEELVGGTAVFLQGAGADINPVFHAHTPHAARVAGSLLATTAGTRILRGLRDAADPQYVNLSWNGSFPLPGEQRMRPVTGDSIAVLSGVVQTRTVARPEPVQAAAELARARRAWQAALDPAEQRSRGAELGQAWAEELRSRDVIGSGMLDSVIDGEATDVALTVRALHLGDSCVICALPGEIFHATAAELRRTGDSPSILLAGYARQSVGYLPPVQAYADAGYEVGAALLRAGTVESLAEAAVDLIAGRGAPR